jgi:hypothetical protein
MLVLKWTFAIFVILIAYNNLRKMRICMTAYGRTVLKTWYFKSLIFLAHSVLHKNPGSHSFDYEGLPEYSIKSKVVPLHAIVALGGRGGIAPTHF